MHMSTNPTLASLNVQHLPHVKKQVLAQRLYAHVYKPHTSLSQCATSSTREETSPKDHMHTSTREETKTSPKDQMHMSTKPRLASLNVHHLPHMKKQAFPPKIIMHNSTREERSPRPKIMCTFLQNQDQRATHHWYSPICSRAAVY